MSAPDPLSARIPSHDDSEPGLPTGELNSNDMRKREKKKTQAVLLSSSFFFFFFFFFFPCIEGVTRIKFEELSFEKLIGEGNYGDVHKGKYFEVDVGTCDLRMVPRTLV
jgi:hypothetical protein